MSDQGPLIVPMTVEALVVNDHVRLHGKPFVRAQMAYNRMRSGAGAQVSFNDSDVNFTSGSPVPPRRADASEYYNGVYLKWRLPKALTRGVQTVDASRAHPYGAGGSTMFPCVPNRWVVVRWGGPLETRDAKAWVVESDYAWRSTEQPADTAAGVGAAYLEEVPGSAPRPTYIGRSVELGSWKEPGTSLRLSAVGPGNPAFAVYQPHNNNVFSFVDVRVGAAPATLAYLVFGWYSNRSDDPLGGTDPFDVRMRDLAWALAGGVTGTATWSLLCGSVTGVEWQSDEAPPGGAPDASSVSVAMGRSGVEALTALVSSQAAAAGRNVEPELLEAFQLEMLHMLDEPDGAAQLEEKLHETFFQRFAGGFTWDLVDRTDGAEVSAAERARERAWLAALETDQRALDEAIRELTALQIELYVMWWKYTIWPRQFEGETVLRGRDGRGPLVRADLAAELDPSTPGSIAQRAAAQMEVVTGALEKVPHGLTPEELAESIKRFSSARGLPAERELQRMPAPSFYAPSNPVIVLAGAGASGIVPPADVTVCRFPSQLVTAVDVDGVHVDASTPGVTIPYPDLSGVAGAPWPAELADALAREAFFLDSDNAAAIGIAGVTQERIAASMQDPARVLPAYPHTTNRKWDRNPWHPLLLFWTGRYYPIDYATEGSPNWSLEGGRYAWNGNGASPEPMLAPHGVVLLTPAAAVGVAARVRAFLDKNPSLEDREKEELKNLLDLVQSPDNAWDLLSQSLDGFNEQLRLGRPGVFMGHGWSPPEIDAIVADLIAPVASYPPGLGRVPHEVVPPDAFQPWRSGQFAFSDLVLVDEWGQAVWPISSSTRRTEKVYVPPELTAVLTSNRVPFTVTDGDAPWDAVVTGEGDAPVITSLFPDLIEAGTATAAFVHVSARGSGFVRDSVVRWGTTELATNYASEDEVIGLVPSHLLASPAEVSVTVTAGERISEPVAFRISPGPAIGSLAPPSAVAGGAAFTLTVRGVGFEESSRITWDGAPLETTVVDGSLIHAAVPANAIDTPGTFEVAHLFGHSVEPDEPDAFVQLPPALLQPARLEFDLLSAIDDAVVVHAGNPDADPLCGWVLPNHLDSSLMVYDANGGALGELGIGVSVAEAATPRWTPAPDGGYDHLADLADDEHGIPHLGPFVAELGALDAAGFAAFLTAVDETLWTTTPMGASFDQSLAVLFGRPLALVRSRVSLRLDGRPYADPSWRYTFEPPPRAIEGFGFDIELGNVGRLEDGLIGYFLEDDYRSFNVVHAAGATNAPYLRPIGPGNHLRVTPDAAHAIHVSMLMDPRARVHATSAILPTISLELPPRLVAAALARMSVTFRLEGVLTEQRVAAGTDPVPDPTILLPLPGGTGGTWSWLENDRGVARRYDVDAADALARLSNVAPVLRRGLLQLSEIPTPSTPEEGDVP